jgi:RNA polymerase sigma-70 factor (ECF subfamily)
MYLPENGVTPAGLPDTTQIDDAVAEVFAVAWRRLDQVPPQPLPWLLAVARRVCANARRSQSRARRLRDRLRREPPRDPGPVAGVDPDLARALRTLSDADRELLCLLAWEQLTLGEAALVMGISAGAAKVRMHRARRRLAAALGERMGPDGVVPEEVRT